MHELANTTEHPATAVELHPDILYSLMVHGQLNELSEEQRVAYYAYRCSVLGIDPAERPFDLLNLKGKMVLYLTKAGAAALTRVNCISVGVESTTRDGSLIIVCARATASNGRFADDVGVVDLDERDSKGSLPGHANAYMKATTKAKRRAIIALVGIGVIDESEIHTINGARTGTMDITTGKVDYVEAETVEPVVAKVNEPLCSGKAAGIARSNAEKIDRLSTLTATLPREVWRSSVIDAGLFEVGDRIPPGPPHLTVTKGKQLRAWLTARVAEVDEDGEINPTERQPGDDGDGDEQADLLDGAPF